MQITSCLLLLFNQIGAESCLYVSSLSTASVICIKLFIPYLVISCLCPTLTQLFNNNEARHQAYSDWRYFRIQDYSGTASTTPPSKPTDRSRWHEFICLLNWDSRTCPNDSLKSMKKWVKQANQKPSKNEKLHTFGPVNWSTKNDYFHFTSMVFSVE